MPEILLSVGRYAIVDMGKLWFEDPAGVINRAPEVCRRRKMNIKDVIMLLGGVALFLFGMSLMGDGLKKVAGSKLEIILYRLSGTALKGILLGTGVTAVIQSSSATSVMAVGFVNSGMMKVRQAISVIMGAIVGTSITGWIIALSDLGGGSAGVLGLLSTETLSAAAAVAGILMTMVGKKKTVKQLGDILLGFAVLMFGMKTMSGAVSGLKSDPAFIRVMTGFRSPLPGLLIGALFTAVLQSASAAVGILQALSSTGVLTCETVIPIIMGIAIGASAPVILASVGATPDGKKTAFAYPVIEVLRVMVFAVIFYGADAVLHFGFTGKIVNTVDIALINTLFRAVTVLILIPFIGFIGFIVDRLVRTVPEDAGETKPMERLEERFLSYPPLAVEQSRLAISGMAQNAKKNYFEAVRLMHEYSDEGFDRVEKLEGVVDKYEDRIGKYLVRLTGRDMSEAHSWAVGAYLHAISDLERISDESLNLAESFREMNEKQIEFSLPGNREIAVLSRAVGEMISTTLKGFEDGNVEMAYMAEALEEVIDDLCDEIKLRHIERLQREECTLEKGYILNDLLTNYERIGDQCSNIATAMIVRDRNLLGRHEYSAQEKSGKEENVAAYEEEYRDKYNLR